MIKKIITNRSVISLLLISFAYLAMWILGIVSFAIGPLVQKSLITLDVSRHIYLYLFYLLSLFLPLFGILLFMDNMRPSSPKWYWGIPLFVSIFLITFLRDSMYMASLYNISFVSAYDNLHILDSQIGKAFVTIFFSISSLLFTLSVPENKRKLMKAPLIISIFMSISIVIYCIVDLFSNTYSETQIFGILHVLGVFLFGVSLVRVAIDYEK